MISLSDEGNLFIYFHRHLVSKPEFNGILRISYLGNTRIRNGVRINKSNKIKVSNPILFFESINSNATS